jgi:hypothetical protein
VAPQEALVEKRGTAVRERGKGRSRSGRRQRVKYGVGPLHGVVRHHLEGSALQIMDCANDGLRGSPAGRREFDDNGTAIAWPGSARDEVPSFETIKDSGQRGRPRPDGGAES